MVRRSFVQFVCALLFACIFGQPAAQAQSANDIEALNRQIAELGKQNKYAEAMKPTEQLLSYAEKALGPKHPDTLKKIRDLADLYQKLGRYAQAEPLIERVLTEREKALGSDHILTLQSVHDLAGLYYTQGRHGEAEPLYKRVLLSLEKTQGLEHRETAAVACSLGLLHQRQGRYAEAERLLRRGWMGLEKAFGPEHSSTLTCISNLGVLVVDQGRYGEAESIFRQVLARREKVLGPEHHGTLVSLNNLAKVYKLLGRYKEAEPLVKRALDSSQRIFGAEHPDTLSAIDNLAALYKMQGRGSEAEPLYKQAVAGREKSLGLDHPETLQSVNDLGQLYRDQGRYREAESLVRRALAGHVKTLGETHQATIIIMRNLAALYIAQYRYNDAEPLLRQVLSNAEKALGLEHPETLASVTQLAVLYHYQNRPTLAEPLYKRALSGYEKLFGPKSPLTLSIVSDLGALYSIQGHYQQAGPFLKRAMEGQEQVLGPEHPNTLMSINSLAAFYLQQGAWRDAARYWMRSTNAIAKRVRQGAREGVTTGSTKSEAERKSWQFWGLIKAAYRIAPEDRAADPFSSRDMFQVAQWALSSETAQSLALMAARGATGDPKLGALVRERQDWLRDWEALDAWRNNALGQDAARRDAKAEEENTAALAAINKRINEIDERLRVDFADYFALASPEPLSVEEVQAQLGADEALILLLSTPERFGTPEESFIWVVTKTQMRWVRSDLGSATLAREVAALRCGLDWAAWERQSRCADLTGQSKPGALLPFDHARAHRLYKALFDQIEPIIKGKHLLIVPSGALTQLPFAVLETAPPTGNHRTAAWLARDHAITVLPAVSSLKALRATGRPSGATKPLIGFGNPLLNGSGEQSAAALLARERQVCAKTAWQRPASIVGSRAVALPMKTRDDLADVSLIRALEPLPETADELCAVSRDAGADAREIRLGGRTTEHEVKALSEAGTLAQYRMVHFATHGAMAGELGGLHEPGLILTPPAIATEDDDGYLTAAEIAALKLDADWVILSACNTAAGNATSAEALAGLARAFFYAQARSLLVSHWAVNSEATVKLITTAMREIAKKSVGRAEALRRAMLALIDEGGMYDAHPAFWAPFIVVGEGALRDGV